MYYLQTRWQLENGKLYYYGLRNRENMFCNHVSISKKQAAIVAGLPKELTEEEIKCLDKLIGQQIVEEQNLKIVPKSLSEAKFCKKCCANDFIIPGLEFDEAGLCPMCQTETETQCFKSILPIVEEIPHALKSRFDVAVFYTGGKDSTFLLYYLSKVKNLRVLALTWEIPFMSDTAKQSIDNAKRVFENVEFINHYIKASDLKRFYANLYLLSENTCACPSLAYLLFYSTLVENRVPYFLAGNEPVQMKGLYYNHMAPRIAYKFAESRGLTFLFNLGRVLTFHPPLKQGQFQTLMTMKQLAYGDSLVQRLSGYSNPLVSNIVKALHSVPEFLPPLKRAICRSSWTGNVPAFVHFDFDRISGGKYDWNKVKDILVKECGWVAPSDENKALHTSCKIEKCKDYSQFVRFYHCKSKMIPFSAIEISLASRNCGRTKEEMIYEMEHLLGFSLEEISECALMRAHVGREE